MTAPAALVLVVDDVDAGRYAKCETLRRAGYRVLEAATGAEAIATTFREHPDLILLDVNLPDISGFEVCRLIKEADSPHPIQVAQLSSTAVTDADRVKGLTWGADAYLTEPLPGTVLVATIRAMLRAGAAERALSESLSRERQAREEAERANRLKDEFLAALSHELRTPLSTMVGWIWQLRHTANDEDMRERAIEGLERSTAIQVRLINDLLDVSRIGKGKLDLQLGPVHLPAVVEAAVEAVRAAAHGRNIVIAERTGPVAVVGDASRLQQVVVNLLTNAIQFSPDGGLVEVSIDGDGPEVMLKVRDHGRGIDPALLPHIFEPFRQGEGGFARRHGGLGLGLAIVKQLVALHGGRVWAESAGRGQGATFTVALPQNSSADVPVPDRRAEGGDLLRDLRLLVVEDDDDSRDWLATLLTSEQATVLAAASSAEAMVLASHEPFDLLISDVGLPGQDGLQLLTSLRQAGYAMPAVALTAFCAPAERTRILAAGFQAHFGKPVETSEFLAYLGEVGDRIRAARTADDGTGPD